MKRLYEIEIWFDDHPFTFYSVILAESEAEARESGNRIMEIMRENPDTGFVHDSGEYFDSSEPQKLHVQEKHLE